MKTAQVQQVGFRDIASYFIPGFVLLLAILLTGWMGPLERFTSYHPSILIFLGAVGSYLAGQISSSVSTFLILYHVLHLRDPRVYLISSIKGGAKLFDIFFVHPDFAESFKSLLVGKLKKYWGEALVNVAPLEVYLLCVRLTHQHSPANAYLLERSISLANMHGSMVFSFLVLAFVLFTRVETAWFGFFPLFAAALSIKRWYGNRIEQAKIVYRTFYMIRHEEDSEQKTNVMTSH